jgi:ABC-type branched-subunit amino acid transport system substrate-binding protein
VLGSGQDAGRLQAAIDGARVAAEAIPSEGVLAGGAQVRGFDTGGSPAGFQKALKEVRAAKAAGVIAVPAGDQHLLYWKAARSLRVPWASVAGLSPDGERNPGNLFHVGPTVVGQAIVAADTLLAPLAARRVAILHEPSDLGRELAAGVSRNLSPHVTLAGIQTWESDSGAGALQSLRGLEAGWVYVGLNGAPLHHFLAALAAGTWRPRLLFAEGARDESLLTAAGDALEGCVFLGGPDPELQGRLGESLVRAFERAGRPLEVVGVRAFEAARRLLTGFAAADGVKLKAVWAALDLETPQVGVLGRLGFSHPGAVRFFPLTLWRVEKGRYEPWPAGLLPTAGCGPPLGFGPPRPAAVHPKGKLAVLTYGSEDKRTIEADLGAIGLSTGGATPALDALVRDEILARAIRIANRLFRREADGTPIAGWSWGMGFTTTPPAEDVKRSRLWLAICAGDHPDAGGQAFGSWVAVYTSFLKRTMYERRKLDPVLSAADLPLLDGSYRWGSDRASNFRADKIRCLMDGFASAMGLTLSHELGHLCGCGHDTEHPTSIMNVVAGAGASWEEAVWIPRHERKVTTTLGVEALPR